MMQVTVKYGKNKVGFITKKDAGRIKNVQCKGEKFCVLFVSNKGKENKCIWDR